MLNAADNVFIQMVAFGNGWRMRMLMNGRMDPLPHGPHWKFPPDGHAAAWLIPNFSLLIPNYHDTSRQPARFLLAVDFLPPITGARYLQVRERSPIANSTARVVHRMDWCPHG